MRKYILLSIFLLSSILAFSANIQNDVATYGSMYQWSGHNAFTYVDQILSLGNKIYGLSANNLFSVNKSTGLIQHYNKSDGLSASNINHIACNPQLNRMLMTYENGQIDIMTHQEKIYNISDLYLKQMNGSKKVNDICMYQEKAYLAMSFGIMVINMRKMEIEDTYYIGPESSEVNVQYICTANEKIYATTNNALYYATLGENLADYHNWNTIALPPYNTIDGMRSFRGRVYLLFDKQINIWQDSTWNTYNTRTIEAFCKTQDELFVVPEKLTGLGKMLKEGPITWMFEGRRYHSILRTDDYYWLGSDEDGLIKYNINTQEEEVFYPDGPSSNLAYKLRFFGDKLYMVPGGRWSDGFKRQGEIMIYEDNQWTNIRYNRLWKQNGWNKVLDFMNVAQDPLDPNHIFVTSYGTGLYELYNDSITKIYLPENSNLTSAAPNNPLQYTRTDGATYDDQGNLWILNMGGGDTKNIHVITPAGQWHSFNATYQGKTVEMHTTGDILIDRRNAQWKWIPNLRYNTGIILLQDNGTPTDPRDDHTTYRTEWIDQNNNRIAPNTIYTMAQDQYNAIWVGTGNGIFVIPPSVDFTNSNKCLRVVLRRNDGTNLGDYLLDNEQVNDIKVDHANRLWVATANSGVYLLAPVGHPDDYLNFTVETVAHFTIENSILPSNEVVSIAIQESTGEVFFGTGIGLVSYMSDATVPEADFTQLYAYPNPVRPHYQGYITFKGLMENTQLRIIDPSGNLIKIIETQGGSATWDATNARGERVASGVYTAICNTLDGQQHGTTKVLIIN